MIKYLIIIALSVLIATSLSAADSPNEFPSEVNSALELYLSFQVFSLDPVMPVVDKKKDFHGYKILGRKTLKDLSKRKLIAKLLQKKVAFDVSITKGCFNPRHGIRLSEKYRDPIDLLICFECNSIRIYSKGKELSVLLDYPVEQLLNRELLPSTDNIVPSRETK